MASFVTFEKIGEDETGVRFRFGFADGEVIRTLVFKPGAESRPEPEDGIADPEFVKAATKIWRTWEQTGEWPVRGAHAS